MVAFRIFSGNKKIYGLFAGLIDGVDALHTSAWAQVSSSASPRLPFATRMAFPKYFLGFGFSIGVYFFRNEKS